MKLQNLKWYEAAGLIALFTISLLLLFFPLPDVVLHYDFYGNPTSFGNPEVFTFIPISGILLFFFIRWITKFDRLINYPVKITLENAKVQKELITMLIKWYGLIILYSTLGITLFAFVPAGKATILGLVILLSFIYLAPLPYYLHKANKYK
ncbi:MAG: hypothetical protein RBS07_06690 [Lentimicrobium sp.]|jgi:hypothetical protein|nr:hypothetical protein [Lentimicrobium sp.]